MVPEGRADTLAPAMRALIVTNMYPSAQRPALGSFVRDQVEALRKIPDLDLEVFAFTPGGAGAYVRAVGDVRRRYGSERFDIVHAHFGLSLYAARAARGRAHLVTLHGTDLTHPRSRPITLGGLRLMDMVATVSEDLAMRVPKAAFGGPRVVLPAGVATTRFQSIPRAEARAALGLDPEQPYLLFPADPRRPEKRHDRAAAVAGDVRLLTLGAVPPEQVPLWINAASAVLVTSERESYGLAVLEALACDVPVLSTPVGIAPTVLAGVEGTYCGEFDVTRWRNVLAPHLQSDDPRVAGRVRAEEHSCDRMAERVLSAWRTLL
jgi:glycosyltransferase involved in cell wall biosynthesis